MPLADEDKAIWPPVSPVGAGLKCTCPRCGQGRLYAGVLTPARRCMSCGLDYSFIDSGDGPAVFVILILGFVVVGLALFVETTFSPPFWVHVVLWIPLIVVAALWALRVTKAFMIALQYRTSASEGRLH
ncbi:MAG: membrane protein [Alphaproteobacteria bacterium]|nr:MAG: membrane protein [Alphaproteobacteria bacterium]